MIPAPITATVIATSHMQVPPSMRSPHYPARAGWYRWWLETLRPRIAMSPQGHIVTVSNVSFWPAAGVRERQLSAGQREWRVLGKAIGSGETRSRPIGADGGFPSEGPVYFGT